MADISKIKLPDNSTYDIKDTVSRAFVNNAKNQFGYQYKTDVIVYGDSDKYYPVYLNGGDQNVPREVMIARSYGERAPSDWNTATHKGGLTVKIKLNYGGWGGAEYKSVILDFAQSYSTTFAKVQAGVNSGMNAAFWLRGGGETGALYHFYSDMELVNTRYHGNFPFIGTTQGDYIMYSGDTPESSTYKWTVPAPLTAQDVTDIDSKYTDKLSQNAVPKTRTVNGKALSSNISLTMSDISGTVAVANGGTGKTTANDAANALISGLPDWTATPTDDTKLIRRDTANSATFGQVKFSTVWAYIKSKIESIVLSTSTSSTSTTTAATSSAVKTAYDLANTANGTANSALSGVNGNLIYDQTFTISNGIATFTPHVYQKGTEVTTNYATSCFVWKYRTIDGTEVGLTTNNDRGCTVTITNMGYGGHVIGIFTPA